MFLRTQLFQCYSSYLFWDFQAVIEAVTFPVLNVARNPIENIAVDSQDKPAASGSCHTLPVSLKLIILQSQRWLTVMIVQPNLRIPIVSWITLKIA
jgi:hypothetical protein